MFKFFVRGFVLLFFVGCVSTAHRDPAWSPDDEAALASFHAAAKAAAGQPTPKEKRLAALSSPAAMADAAALASTGPLLEIYMFNLGQADSMLVIGPKPERKTLLIDLGEPSGGTRPAGFTSSAAHVRKRIRELTKREDVDYFVLTHYHGDHAGSGKNNTGIIGLLSDFPTDFFVGEFIHVGADTEQFAADENERSIYKTIKSRMQGWIDAGRVGVSSEPRFGTGQIDLGSGVEVEILAFGGNVPSGPPSAFDRAIAAGRDYSVSPANENDFSIALEIRAGDFEMFTAGDLNGTDDPQKHPLFVHRTFGGGKTETYTNIEHHLIRHWETTQRNSDVEVFRADHHGSEYSNTAKLIGALRPEFVLYSTGGQYGHPQPEAITRAGSARQLATTAVGDKQAFKKAGGKIAGEINIEVAVNGRTYTVEGQQQTATAR
jgi:beta-lactamase superfamily II metal-dependent hydrolase